METEVAVIQDTGFWLHLQNGNSAKKKKKKVSGPGVLGLNSKLTGAAE